MSDFTDRGGAGMAEGLPPACAAVNDDLGELALGTLTGIERMAALAHMEVCARCSAEVDELSAAADELLHLAPSSEPPVGFEAGVFERLGVEDKRRTWRPGLWRPAFSWRYLWRPKVAAIGAGVAALAFGLGAFVAPFSGGGSGGLSAANRTAIVAHTPIYDASLQSGGRTVGQVLVYPGNPTWLFMYMDDASWQGALRCEVMMDQGPTLTLGRFWLSDGRGAWAASVPQPAGRLTEARVVNEKGQVMAEAKLA